MLVIIKYVDFFYFNVTQARHRTSENPLLFFKTFSSGHEFRPMNDLFGSKYVDQ
jgi:hypothetical protein